MKKPFGLSSSSIPRFVNSAREGLPAGRSVSYGSAPPTDAAAMIFVPCLAAAKLRAGAEHAVPLLAGKVVDVLQVALPPRAPVDAAPREVVEAALDHLDADLVEVGPGGTRGVEGRRSGRRSKRRM